MESLYQGSKDVFLAKVRADFDAIEDQSRKGTQLLKSYNIVGTDPMANSIFTTISNVTDDGDRAVWRHVGTSAIVNSGENTRRAGGSFPAAEFIRTYETAVYDPDSQFSKEFRVPEEREKKEGTQYKSILNRAAKLLDSVDRQNIKDSFELFNLAFALPSVYPTRFFARGNMGLDGNNTALGEKLVSTSHARADGGTAWSNAVVSGGNASAFDNESYWAARELASTFVDDVGNPYPRMGGMVDIVIPHQNGQVKLAKQIQDSEWEVETAENQVNIHKGQFARIVTSPYLNSSAYLSTSAYSYAATTTKWFLVDTVERDSMVGSGFVCITFVPFESKTYRDNDVDSIVYHVKQEYVWGWVDPRTVVGTPGDGAAFAL